jgi:hypothetical protein
MPLAGVTEAAKDYHAKKAAAESGGILYFGLEDGEEATIRPLEQDEDFVTYYVHRLPQQGNRFPQIPCLDQSARPSGRIACPGCEEGIKRSFKFALNLIHRDAPVPVRDKDNKVVKENGKIRFKDGVREDQVKVWTSGIQVAESLDHLNSKYGGLTTMDFDVSRRGVKLDTVYTILPAGQKTPLSDKDKKLAAAKFDLNQFKKPPEYDQFYSYQGGGGGGNANGSPPTVSEAGQRQSPFKRRDRTA